MLYIALALLTLIIILIAALDRSDPPAQDDTDQTITYTQAGKVSDGSLWKR